MRKGLPGLFLLLSSMAFGQTVTFSTQGGGADPLHYTVVSEDGEPASGTVQISEDYGYPNSGIVLPTNPVAPGQYLNPIITITNVNVAVASDQSSRTITYTFNSDSDPQYGYVWSGTFSGTQICTLKRYGKCTNFGKIGNGVGMMTAAKASKAVVE